MSRNALILAVLILLLCCGVLHDYWLGPQHAAAVVFTETAPESFEELYVEPIAIGELTLPETLLPATQPFDGSAALTEALQPPPIRIITGVDPLLLLSPKYVPLATARRYEWLLGPILSDRPPYRIYITDLSTPQSRWGFHRPDGSDHTVNHPDPPSVSGPIVSHPNIPPITPGDGTGVPPPVSNTIPEPMLLPLVLVMALRFARPRR